ncbi:MAG: CotH kinase family protein [Fibrobacter sp.]|nr:CotH kinase family protein [Fibrobacter sp.]
MMSLSACRNSVEADNEGSTTSLQSSGNSKGKSSSSVKSSSSKKSYPDSFKPNDKEYPYADIPRVVIYTKNQQKIKDRETEIPAKLQIWGEKEAESEVLNLTIRGRGNSSWEMPKKSYKIEFEKKQSMLGMPKDKDWALIANYADKTLIRNYIAYHLSATISSHYAPRCDFVELYVNEEYLGVYLLTETVKIGENRVNIPKSDYSYIVEVDGKYKDGEITVFSDVISSNGIGKAFRIHYPKNVSDASLDTVQNHIRNFERFLKSIKKSVDNDVEKWIDVEVYVKHYWIQECLKNPDASFYTSVFFSWVKGEKIEMGPVWDFDLAMGNHSSDSMNLVENWQIRNYWNSFLFKDSLFKEKVFEEWNSNRMIYESVNESIDVIAKKIKRAAKNNFKRWNILDVSKNWLHGSYRNYDEAINDLKKWIKKRNEWIDSQM